MKLPILLSLLLSILNICHIYAWGLRAKTNSTAIPTCKDASIFSSKKDSSIFSRAIQSHAQKLFEESDTNQDGSLYENDVYDLVLKIYIKVNQEAPIDPPSRERVMTLFHQADVLKTGTILPCEFEQLLKTLYARASSRVLTYKIINMVGGPFCAITLINTLKNTPNVMEWISSKVLSKLPSKPMFVMKMVTTEAFWVGVLTSFFVDHLASIALTGVDWLWWGGGNIGDLLYDHF